MTEVKNQEYRTKVLIIGSGPAGYSAAIYAARAGLKPILVTGMEQGGQLMTTTEVENYPGFASPIEGPWLMDQMKQQSENVGATHIVDYIIDVDFSKPPFSAKGGSGNEYIGDTIIISTGAKARWLGIPSEEKYKGRGVSACATCDGFFFKDQHVAVIGGGNTAAEEALFLTNFCSKVTMIHRRDSLRAEKILQERVFANNKIELLWNSSIDEFIGDERGLTALKIRNTHTKELSNLAVDGAFIAIGHDPATEIFVNKLDMDDNKYIITAPDSTVTSVKGVYAAGDVTDHVYQQAVTAAAMGCMAALEADRYLATKK